MNVIVVSKVVIIFANWMENPDIIGDFDLSRSDKRYLVKIPSYKMQDTTPYYEIHLKDLVQNTTFVSQYRYNTFKEWH